MNIPSRSLLLGFFLLSVGCTKATPGFTTLDESSIPQPMFSNGTTEIEIALGSAASTIPITGTCDSKITDLVAIPVNSASSLSLTSMVVGAIQVSCGSTGFSFTLKSLSDLGFTGLSSGGSYVVQVRGVTSGGISKASTITLKYVPYEREKLMITSGSSSRLDVKDFFTNVNLNPGGVPYNNNWANTFLSNLNGVQAQIRIGHFSNKVPANLNEALVKTSPTYKFQGGVAGSVGY